MNRIVLASGNAGKLRELQAMLAPLDISLLSLSDFVDSGAEETGLTFVENALLKARHACSHSGLPAIADDSGLCVRALAGAPGIHSARYAGHHGDDAANNEKLLRALAAKTDRRAWFHCAVVFMRHAEDPQPIICEASWHGTIVDAPRGDNGFGYDPLFLVEGEGCTSAELPAQRKNKVSHRGQAVGILIDRLRAASGAMI